eukprot:gene23396-biopygen16356
MASENESKQRGVVVRGKALSSLAPLARRAMAPNTGRNDSGRAPDARRTTEFEETDARRTRAEPFLPGVLDTSSALGDPSSALGDTSSALGDPSSAL